MLLAKLRIRPKLIIFDLDHTLWPFGVDDFVYKFPYRKDADGEVKDMNGSVMKCYPEVTTVLHQIKSNAIDIGIASRSEFPEGGNSLIQLFGIDKYIKYKEIYPGTKLKHFQQFQTQSNLSYKDMLFFDNEIRNIDDVTSLGVTSILVDPNIGVTMKVIDDGLRQFASFASSRSKG